MSAAQHTRFASPATLLREWTERGDKQPLHEVLLLGFTVDLPFLERVAIPVARGLGARTAVIGDAAQGLYDPVDVRMAGRSYLHGLAGCRGAFHPKVVLLIGEHACRLAVGSGNPTLSGWGANDELWTVVETEDDASHALLADLAGWLGELPAVVDMAPWTASHIGEVATLLTERHVNSPAAPEAGPRLLHNLHRGLVEQLPPGPVEEVHAYAPFIDPQAHALRALVDRLKPGQVTLGLQPRWSSYDAETVKRALDGCSAGIRLLEETRMRHGKFVEWRIGEHRHALTGSPNLTRAALCTSTREGGNCELAVLSADTSPLLPEEGPTTALTSLRGRTLRPFTTGAGRALVLLGAKTDSEGLHVALARSEPTPVVISASPDGSPGSWTAIGSIPAGRATFSFPMPEVPGAAVRANCRRLDGSSVESPVVFVYSPVHSARRHTHDSGPRLSHDYTTQALFTDERAARRFETDLLRLRELTAGMSAPRVSPATESATSTAVTSGVDRWDAYLADCRRMIGLPLTDLAFGTAQIDLPQPSASRWIVSTVTLATAAEEDEAHDEETEDEDPTVDGAVAVPHVPPEQRTRCRVWAQRWAGTLVDPDGSPAQPLPVRLLMAGLYVQLLAAGVWDDDHSWREDLSGLLGAIDPQDGPDGETAEQQPPPETGRRADAVAAVLMTLLSQDATFTGGSEYDVLAARAWQNHRSMIARADPAAAKDLMLPPEQALARVAPWSEVERLVHLAKEDDPHAEVIEELSKAGWSVGYEDGIWGITGSFGNPVPVVARAADRLGRHHADGVLVRARGRRRWAFAAWAKPRLVLLNPPARVWRTYEVRTPATPESRFSGGDLSAVPGLVGAPTPLRAGPPEALRTTLAGVELPYPELMRRLFEDAT
ncbi:hypothetical protein [Streptomyces sp. A13(2022)]|uniref:hypothetical protein n=1 Tax=Streptomyces sp. A13(2022) TaxID=2964768 RepID=UPI0021D9FA4E|nr:hypothetical protein [Streptomyces sp. A13(2022)]MCU8591977.1 hypothetical protein [Streptomyces sp. A13(2022)]